MTLFVLSVTIVLIVSAICSLTEAAVYAVRMPFIRQLAGSGSTAGRVLRKFKENMEQPIAAILIVNTAANTAGAAVAGAQARQLFGEASLIWFSVSFTLAVLFFSEIMPKVAGVAYNRTVAQLVAIPLNAVIATIYPFIWLTQQVSRMFKPSEPARIAPEEEVRQMAALSAEEGSILPFESELVQNVLKLDEIKARDIMTPRTVVYKIASTLTVKDVAESIAVSPHARIPVYATDEPENWIGVVLRTDVLAALAKDEFERSIDSLCKPMGFVPDSAPGHKLLNEFIRRREHLLGVVDEYGAVVGVVSLEDVFESLIGKEIVDETDTHVDMQEVARRRIALQRENSVEPKNGRSPT